MEHGPNHPPAQRELVGIDWGTTHRRAYRVAADGTLIESHSDDQGMLVARGRFALALDEMLARLPGLAADAPVLLSGMVGSAQGWHELPYLPTTVPLTDLRQHLFRVPDGPPGRPCVMVPGVALLPDPQDAAAAVDVMRGEETQLLGALALGHGEGWLVLPGTHSKWVHLRAGRIETFRTFMTGELFALLSQHGTLGAMMQGPAQAGTLAVPDAGAFDAGLQAAQAGGLSNALFGCRARVVTGRLPVVQARDYLSGVLIGAEFAAARALTPAQAPGNSRIDRLHVVGSPVLAARYQQAGRAMGVAVDLLDPQAAYVAALAHLSAAI